MKRALLFIIAFVVASTVPVHAGLIGWGLGGYGGVNVPIVQDDAGSGTVFGLRGQIQPVTLVRFEPFVAFLKNGEYDIPGIGGPFQGDGGKLNAFGLNAMLGTPMTTPGVGVSLVAGIGSWKYDVDGYESETRVGYTGGVDLSFGVPNSPIAINGRAELLIIPQDGGGSRKHGLITIGAIYKLGL